MMRNGLLKGLIVKLSSSQNRMPILLRRREDYGQYWALPVQAGQVAEKVRELESKLAAAQQQSEQLNAAIQQEQRKIRFFFGQDLEQLGRENLEELEQFHQRSLSRLQPRLVCCSLRNFLIYAIPWISI